MRPLKLRTLVMATDLSEAALPALRTATELARLADAELHVVHAATGHPLVAERALAEHIRAVEGRYHVPFFTVAREGQPDDVIREEAERTGADVIVLGPHRSGGTYPVGGTAYRVTATAERPCLVLCGRFPLPLGRLLVPVDASEAARGALAVALTWGSALRRRGSSAESGRTEIVVLHVNLPTDEGNPAIAGVLNETIAAVRQRVAEVAGVNVRAVEVHGDDVAATIVERAKADDVDLIVLGTRALIGKSAELGSVTAEVVRRSVCPLLLVPPAVWRQAGEETLL